MNWTDLIALLALFIYAVASVAAIAGLLARNRQVMRMAFGLTAAGFCLQSLWLFMEGVTSGAALSSRGAWLPQMAWGLVAVGLGMWWKWRIDAVLLFSPPLAFLLLFTPLALGHDESPFSESLAGPLFYAHLVGVSTGLGLMAVAAAAAAIFLWQQHSLKNKKSGTGLRHDLPALGTLDRINAMATLIGFPAYSLGVLGGFVWARMLWGSLLSGDPKELVSLLIWVVYALLFHQRQALGWQGRKPAIMALIIFGASLFSLFVVNTLLPTHHSFQARM